jgi:hypothetical protein
MRYKRKKGRRIENDKRRSRFLFSRGCSGKRSAVELSIGAINRNVDGTAPVNSRGEEVGYFKSVHFKLLQAHRGDWKMLIARKISLEDFLRTLNAVTDISDGTLVRRTGKKVYAAKKLKK